MILIWHDAVKDLVFFKEGKISTFVKSKQFSLFYERKNQLLSATITKKGGDWVIQKMQKFVLSNSTPRPNVTSVFSAKKRFIKSEKKYIWKSATIIIIWKRGNSSIDKVLLQALFQLLRSISNWPFTLPLFFLRKSKKNTLPSSYRLNLHQQRTILLARVLNCSKNRFKKILPQYIPIPAPTREQEASEAGRQSGN